MIANFRKPIRLTPLAKAVTVAAVLGLVVAVKVKTRKKKGVAA